MLASHISHGIETARWSSLLLCETSELLLLHAWEGWRHMLRMLASLRTKLVLLHLHGVAAVLGLLWWLLIPIPLLIPLLHLLRHNFGKSCCAWPLRPFDVSRIAAHCVVLCRVLVVVAVPVVAGEAGVIAW